MTTRVLSADVCRRGAICHGGYTALAERNHFILESRTRLTAAVAASSSPSRVASGCCTQGVNVGGRTLYGKRLVDVMAFDGSMEVTSGYQDVSIDVFDVNGAALDNVGWVMSASASGVDCGVVGDGAGDVVFALNESMAAYAPIAEAVAAVSLIGTGGFVLADGTHAGVTAARAAGLSAAASVGAQFHAASAHTLAAAAGIAEQVTAELGTALCETYSAGAATTESDFDPGDHAPRPRRGWRRRPSTAPPRRTTAHSRAAADLASRRRRAPAYVAGARWLFVGCLVWGGSGCRARSRASSCGSRSPRSARR